ncbi:unnamed protein product, partial [Ascophyllum nodosum]
PPRTRRQERATASPSHRGRYGGVGQGNYHLDTPILVRLRAFCRRVLVSANPWITPVAVVLPDAHGDHVSILMRLELMTLAGDN